MPSIKLHHAQQAAALQLLQTLCAYPESSLSQGFQKLAHSLPTDGQADIKHWEQLTAFFQAQGVDMEDFAGIAESLYESPAAWAGFADHCVYTLLTGDAGSSSPDAGQVVFDRASGSASAETDSYAITYNAPDGSATPLYFTQGKLVSALAQENPAIDLQTAFAPNEMTDMASGVMPVLIGNVNGQQAVGVNLDETSSDNFSKYQCISDFIETAEFKRIIKISLIGSGVLTAIMIVGYFVFDYIDKDEEEENEESERKESETDPKEVKPKIKKVTEDLEGDYIKPQRKLETKSNKPKHQTPEWIKDLDYDTKMQAVEYLATREAENRSFTPQETAWFKENIKNNARMHEFMEELDHVVFNQKKIEHTKEKLIDSLKSNLDQNGINRDIKQLSTLDPFDDATIQKTIKDIEARMNIRDDFHAKDKYDRKHNLNRELSQIEKDITKLKKLSPFDPSAKQIIEDIKQNQSKRIEPRLNEEFEQFARQVDTVEVNAMREAWEAEQKKLLDQKNQIKELQQISNSSETRELLLENETNYRELLSLNPTNLESCGAGLVKVQSTYESTNESVQALQQQYGIAIESQPQSINQLNKLNEEDLKEKDESQEHKEHKEYELPREHFVE